MKTLRTVCFVCAGYYLLQCLGFVFASQSTQMVHGLMPREIDGHPIVHIQQGVSSVMAAFAPYVLIGAAMCLLMALCLKQCWKAIPLLSVLLLAGGLVWLVAFIRRIRPFNRQLGRSFGESPDSAFGGYMEMVAGIGNWSSALPALLPGVLIFIFWLRAERRAATA